MAGQLGDELAAFIRGEGGDFADLSMRLFRRQVRDNDHYRAIVEGRQATVRSWRDIPAVPVALWRDLSLTSFPLHQTCTTFRTSGTTGRRGVVRRRDTSLYDLGSKRFAESVVGRLPEVGVSLVPDAPDSSLGHMVRSFSPGLRQRFTAAGGVDVAGAWADLRELSGPVFVPGTALALAALVEAAPGPVPLQPGSVVMVTGGFKGRQVSVTPALLRAELRRLLPGAQVVAEYGMTELSSQMWAPGPGEPLVLPPWLRVVPVDPGSGERVVEGTGLLRFVDLANADTVLAIETRDMGRLLPDGRLVLAGRLPGSPARGCSLSVEEATQGGPAALQFNRIIDQLNNRVVEDGAASPDAGGDDSFGTVDSTGLQFNRIIDQLNNRVVEDGAAPLAGADEDLAVGDSTGLQHPRMVGQDGRIHAILDALAHLSPAHPSWGQGIHPDAIAAEVADAAARITAEALRTELRTVPAHRRPRSVAIVEAEGVFTAGLEWVALALAAGLQVRWKPPSAWPHFARTVGQALTDRGLPLVVSSSRDLGTPEVIVAFGSDRTIDALKRHHPQARFVGFGHRFSVAVVDGLPTARAAAAVVRDHTRFDTRGCMAPTAVFVRGEVAAWGNAIHAAFEAWSGPPRGEVDPRLGPEWRRRVDLGHATHGAWTGRQHAVVAVPASAWVPSALPWLVTLVSVPQDKHLTDIIGDWAGSLSSVAGAEGLPAPRRCPLGELQSPRLPRRHDGQPMLGALCGLAL